MTMKCWIITESGLIGTENQCLGVAEALGITPIVKRIGLRQPWKIFSPYLGLENQNSFTGDSLTAPFPDLVIAAGRKAIAAARYIKKASNGKTFVTLLQDPRVSPRPFDLVAVPAHDNLRGPNVIVTQATPNRVFTASLHAAHDKFAGLLSHLPGPRVAVLIGGNSKSYTLTPEIMTDLANDLRKLAGHGASLMVTASRRTGEHNRLILENTLNGTNALIWDGTGDNPYYGFLAWANYIVVTADSASMLSEAATTGKPVYMVPLTGGSARFDKLHANLLNAGVIQTFRGKLEPYNYTPLQDAAMVAKEIRKRLKI